MNCASPRCVCPVVNTEQDVWNRITELADIQQDDVVVDIGCGDGRFLAHAALTCRCQCIGLDVRESCLKATRRSADRWNVRHLVEAVECDFMDRGELQAIVDRATVLYAFLLPHVIREIEDVLLQAVAAGKRVLVFCATGTRARRRDAGTGLHSPATKAGNAIGDLGASSPTELETLPHVAQTPRHAHLRLVSPFDGLCLALCLSQCLRRKPASAGFDATGGPRSSRCRPLLLQ